MTGEGLEPSTNGLTYLIGFHRPSRAHFRVGQAAHSDGSRVEGLDYPFAIAGVPRLVSGAGAGSAPVPCLLITQSAGFSNPHARRYQRRCGARGSQGVPAYCGMHSSRFRFFPREAPNGLPSGRIRSPLLYRLSYPVSGDALQIKPRGPTRPDPLRGARTPHRWRPPPAPGGKTETRETSSLSQNAPPIVLISTDRGRPRASTRRNAQKIFNIRVAAFGVS